jgi:hypothetical protein
MKDFVMSLSSTRSIRTSGVGVGGTGVSVDGGIFFAATTWVSVGSGSVTISAGLAQATIMIIKNKIHIISRTGLRITIPPVDLGIPQIIHHNNTIALFRINFNRFGKVTFSPPKVT